MFMTSSTSFVRRHSSHFYYNIFTSLKTQLIFLIIWNFMVMGHDVSEDDGDFFGGAGGAGGLHLV